MDIAIKGKTHTFPMFLPDATHASVKGVSSEDLILANTKGVVVNTYHLFTDGVVSLIKKSGGIHKFMNHSGLVISDSGGFQAMSLVRRNLTMGKITDDGITFKNFLNGGTQLLTPELCIDIQLDLNSDILMVLDDCTDPKEPLSEQKKSVEKTILWATRCKNHFLEKTKNLPVNKKPLIFGIIQGGNDKNLRKECAQALIKLGFDGFAYGGWPVLDRKLLSEILDYTAHLMPDGKTKYAMGVGKPEDIIACSKMGYNLFDCVIPTRDARHGRIYILKGKTPLTLNIGNSKYTQDFSPLDDLCGCFTCQNYTKAYLQHLYKCKEPLYIRLATIHNLYCFNQVIESL